MNEGHVRGDSPYREVLVDAPRWEAPAPPRFARASDLRTDLPLPSFPTLRLRPDDGAGNVTASPELSVGARRIARALAIGAETPAAPPPLPARSPRVRPRVRPAPVRAAATSIATTEPVRVAHWPMPVAASMYLLLCVICALVGLMALSNVLVVTGLLQLVLLGHVVLVPAARRPGSVARAITLALAAVAGFFAARFALASLALAHASVSGMALPPDVPLVAIVALVALLGFRGVARMATRAHGVRGDALRSMAAVATFALLPVLLMAPMMLATPMALALEPLWAVALCAGTVISAVAVARDAR